MSIWLCCAVAAVVIAYTFTSMEKQEIVISIMAAIGWGFVLYLDGRIAGRW